ncbi:MAG: DUF1080 domain-containing protein [Porphyromonadaceae bacterium]|nr:MAG: DUF1080 domain-containing protein [Porphyromonadaceae bacterium]
MKKLILLLVAACLFGSFAHSQDPALTEDWTRKPPVINPGCKQAPPSDAIILFGKAKDINNWIGTTGPAKWKTSCRKMTVNGTGDIMTKEKFGDCQLHVEFRTPLKVISEGQGRGNSGVYIQTLYEVQVLDSYENETYYNGQAGSVYKQSPPLVNASRKPGKWQAYNIVFHAPRFSSDGSLTNPASVTVFHNGVLVQDHFELKGGTVYAGYPKYEAHGDMPLLLQDHGNPVKYRNVWIRKL